MRHGESAAAVPGRPFALVDGHGDPGLHPEGVIQAAQVGAHLATRHAAGDVIDAIYVTSLRRTAETAEPLATAIGIEPIVERDLREVFLGDWEGGRFREHVAAGDPTFTRVLTDERWDHIPNAEPLDEFDARLSAAIGRIAAAHPDQHVVVFSHGGVIGHLMHRATASRRFAFTAVDNASISEIAVGVFGWNARLYNQTSHLR